MIDIFVNEIRCSLKNKCYFATMALALTLSDICGIAEYPDETLVAKRYIEWYDKYLGAYMAQGKNDLGGNNPWLKRKPMWKRSLIP